MERSLRQAMHEEIKRRARSVIVGRIRVERCESVADTYTRVTFRADEVMPSYTNPRPADAFKFHLPVARGQVVPQPSYDPSGRLLVPAGCEKPVVRCFTVAACDTERNELSFDVLENQMGSAATWLRNASPGDEVAVTGVRTEFVPCSKAGAYILVGDLAALPAVAAILRSLPVEVEVDAFLPRHSATEVMVPALRLADVTKYDGPAHLESLLGRQSVALSSAAWVCGEASLVRRSRRQLLDELMVEPDMVHAAGYWRRGVDWESDFDASFARFERARAAGEDVSDPQVLQRAAFD